MFKPDGFRNTYDDGKAVGFQFDCKVQYYRGITLSIVRDIKVEVDGVEYPRENIRFSIKGETFTLDEMRTVIDHELRWEFGKWATVIVLKEGGLEQGKHHIKSTQIIAPSYMPHILEHAGDYDFEIA